MDIENAKKTIEQTFSLIGTPVESVVYSLDEKKGHFFSVKSAEFDKVSADKDDLVKDMVYLLRRIFEKNSPQSEEHLKCTIDINNRQSKEDEKIKMKALNSAEEARHLKTDVIMEPMSSYDRMLVHSTLSNIADISTESIGEGRERKVKIKYLAI
jgi:predicted RNA-binding protein Jag